MHPLIRPVLVASLWVLAATPACQGGAPAGQSDVQKAADAKVAEQKAAEKKAEDEAKRRIEERKQLQEKREAAYQAAKGKLEPFAKLPKKRPKGFAKACVEMMEQYDAFMQKTLQGDELARWNSEDNESRLQVLRRECHKRAVEVVVCETQVLKKAPADADIAHIQRVCHETFAG